jgi:hypothetical protein
LLAGQSRLADLVRSKEPGDGIAGHFSFSELGEAAGVPVFLSGPHGEHLNYGARDDFGHYNPQFLRVVIDTLLSDDSPDLTKRFLKYPTVRERLPLLAAARCAMQKDPSRFKEFSRDYEAIMKAKKRFSSYSPPLSNYRDWEAGYGAEELAFWYRREKDGTADLVQEGLAKGLRRYALQEFQKYGSCLTGSGTAGANPGTYFVPDSFVDHETWGDPSILPCREKLLELQGFDLASGSPERPAPKTIRGAKNIAKALKAAGCDLSVVSPPHWGLFAEEGTATWRPVKGEFELTVSLKPEGCNEGAGLVALPFRVSGPSPLLLRAGGAGGSSPYLAQTRRGKPVKETGRIPLSHPVVPGVARVYLVYKTEPFYELHAKKPETVVSQMTLWADTMAGQRMKLEERNGVGKYTYSPARIENVTILDANGDGHPDFLYDIDNGGKRLALTRDGALVETVILVTDEYSGVGGC